MENTSIEGIILNTIKIIFSTGGIIVVFKLIKYFLDRWFKVSDRYLEKREPVIISVNKILSDFENLINEYLFKAFPVNFKINGITINQKISKLKLELNELNKLMVNELSQIQFEDSKLLKPHSPLIKKEFEKIKKQHSILEKAYPDFKKGSIENFNSLYSQLKEKLKEIDQVDGLSVYLKKNELKTLRSLKMNILNTHLDIHEILDGWDDNIDSYTHYQKRIIKRISQLLNHINYLQRKLR